MEVIVIEFYVDDRNHTCIEYNLHTLTTPMGAYCPDGKHKRLSYSQLVHNAFTIMQSLTD